jgi:hypothetical protein
MSRLTVRFGSEAEITKRRSFFAVTSRIWQRGIEPPLPFKLIFFVLVDCWTLVAGSLVQSYGS